MVEASHNAKIAIAHETSIILQEENVTRCPVLREIHENPLSETYYVGKQTLKDLYHGNDTWSGIAMAHWLKNLERSRATDKNSATTPEKNKIHKKDID